MFKFRIKVIGLALLVICSLCVLFPTVSFALLRDRACAAIWRGCVGKCTGGGGNQSCYDNCDAKQGKCIAAGDTKKQQTPPPPCIGIRCTLPTSHPPTTVGPPARKPRPVQPAKPVGVSNPNQPNNGPVILYRKNESGGGNGRGH